MKLPIPFKRTGTVAALETAQESLAANERRVAELRDRRATLLLADDAVTQIAEVDREIAATQGSAAINTDRITALEAQLAVEQGEDRQKQRTEQIAVVTRLFANRADASKAVQSALEDLGSAIGRMVEARDKIIKYWPAGLPLPRHDDLRASLDRQIAWALFSGGKIPAAGAIGVPRGLETLALKSVVETVADEHRTLIDRLRNLPIENEAAA
jgi:hypothetical protein